MWFSCFLKTMDPRLFSSKVSEFCKKSVQVFCFLWGHANNLQYLLEHSNQKAMILDSYAIITRGKKYFQEINQEMDTKF